MRAWLEVDLGKLARNYNVVASHVGRERGVIAVVKSDAYGHGIERVSRELDRQGVAGFAVISLEEALTVRRQSDRPVLAMGYLDNREIEEAIRSGITLSLYDTELVPVYCQAAQRVGKPARVQLKVETGLNRLGIALDEASALLANWESFGALHLEGVYSHLSTSSDRETDLAQNEVFVEFLKKVPPQFSHTLIHLCNSHGLRPFPEGYYDQVRVGLALYGVEEVLPGLDATLECKTVIQQRKRVRRGEGVSYNKLFRAPQDMDVAVLAIGYAEGLSQALTGKMKVLVNGHVCPVIGQICMNLCVIDVEGVPARRGDEVTIIGSQKSPSGETITLRVTDMAKAAGIRHHEIITRLGLSLPRVYVAQTAAVQATDEAVRTV